MRWYFFSPFLLQKFIWIPTRLILKTFGHLKVYGLENLRDIPKNAVFACNHTSELDPVLLPAALPFASRFAPIFYTSREKTFYDTSGWRRHFYGGWMFKMWGAYPVFVGLRDYEKAMAYQREIMKDGGNICVYPEGQITPDGRLQPAKGGVAYLAHAMNKPIVPVRINGAFKLSTADFFMGRGRLSVSFGRPLYVSAKENATLSVDDFKMYADFVMKKVGELWGTETAPASAKKAKEAFGTIVTG